MDSKNVVESERNILFDFIRTIAIIAVVWIHCQEQSQIQIPILVTFLYLFGRMGVPLFIMLTGALLIKEKTSAVSFYKKRLIPMYLLCVIWLFIYRYGASSVFDNFKASLNLISSAKHFWYFPVLISLYTAIPFLAVLEKYSTKDLAIILLSIFVISELNTFKVFSLVPGFLCSIYFFYLIFGYFVHKKTEASSFKRMMLGICVIVSALLFYLTSQKGNPLSSYFAKNNIDIWWYNSPLIVLTAVSLFLFLTQLRLPNNKFMNAIFTAVSKCSFGIFVIHLYIIYKADVYICKYIPIGTAHTLILFAVTFILSFLFSFIIGKLPFIRFIVHQKGLSKKAAEKTANCQTE